jgi:hypothetical protein
MQNAKAECKGELKMALNLGNASGDFLPYLKYNAKAGRFYKKEGDNDVEVQSPTFLADFANIKTGWFYYAEGMAPSITYDADLSTPAAKPSDKHKRGFKLTIFSKALFDGEAEFASASMHTCAAINDVYSQYEAEAAKNPGKYAVVSVSGVNPQKDKMGTNYKPVFVISKWVDRPAEWVSGSAAPAAANQSSAPAPVQKAVNEF